MDEEEKRRRNLISVKKYREKNKEKILEYQKEYYLENREYYLEKYAKYNKPYRIANKTILNEKQRQKAKRMRVESNEFRRKCHFNNLKRSALKRGLDYDLRYEDVVWPTHCPLLGIELTYEKGMHQSDNYPHFDRIDSSKGYITGNVWVISKRANQLKNNATLNELELIYNNLKKKMEEV